MPSLAQSPRHQSFTTITPPPFARTSAAQTPPKGERAGFP
jgi:hypothetical protein